MALGRKNWLFCGSDAGGRTAAVLFSLIATCQRHKVEPLGYFRKLLTAIAAHPVTRLAELRRSRGVASATVASRRTTAIASNTQVWSTGRLLAICAIEHDHARRLNKRRTAAL